MYKELETWLHKAENKYLNAQELKIFKSQILEWKDRLETYKQLRDSELNIFQPVADQLQKAYPDEKETRLREALKHWIAIMRYASFAMLTNDPEFLQYRLLEWLTPLIETQELKTVERKVYEILQKTLENNLTRRGMELISPLLEQAKDTLLEKELVGENK